MGAFGNLPKFRNKVAHCHIVELVENELILEFILNTDKPDVVILPITFNVVEHVVPPPTIIGLLTINKELDNVIYEFPEIYQLYIEVLGIEFHKTPAFISNAYGNVEPVPGYNTNLLPVPYSLHGVQGKDRVVAFEPVA